MIKIQSSPSLKQKVSTENKKLWLLMRKTIISTAWKVFHILLHWKNNLFQTAENFSKNYNINIDDLSKKSIEVLRDQRKWVIISNHQNMNFSDYLPLFEQLGEEILEKTIFYTAEWNLDMNNSIFKNNEFRQATFKNISDWKNIIYELQNDLERIQNEWGYIFIIPTWASKEEKFQWIFRRIVQKDTDLPLLYSKVETEQNLWYKKIIQDMYSKDTSQINITTRFWKTSDLQQISWEEMFTYYDELIKN